METDPKKIHIRKGIVVVIILIFLVLIFSPVFADIPEKNVLVIHQYSEYYPYQKLFNTGMEKVFQDGKRYLINYTFEYLKIDKFPNNKEYLDLTMDYMKHKLEYSNSPVDAIISTGGATELLWEYRKELFGDTPIVKVPFCYDADAIASNEACDRDLLLIGEEEFDKNIQMILNAQPNIEKLYVIIGNDNEEKIIFQDIKKASDLYRDKVEFIFLHELSYSEMLEGVHKADGDSAILFVRWITDIDGKAFVPISVLEKVIEESRVPVYGTQKQYLGTGIVGGYLFHMSMLGEDAALGAIQIMDGTDPADFLRMDGHYSQYIFDARALNRWNISTDNLPVDRIIEYQKINIWSEYGNYFIAAIIIIILEMALIIALVSNYRKRTMAEISLIQLNATLENEIEKRMKELMESKEKTEELNRELEHATRIDPLTRLYNRRHMDERLNEARQLYLQTGQFFSVMIMDLDNFKQINDKFGHVAGDEVLKMVAKLIQENVRKDDVVSRWGGEEFLLLFPKQAIKDILPRGEEIRRKIEESVLNYDGHQLSITVTVGIATAENGETIEKTIRRADNALYKGKKMEKNKVMVSV